MRRYLAYLESSLWHGLQWAIFEPNDESLWSRVTQCVSDFLLDQWRSGALQGVKPEQAFFAKCDTTTMTQDDIDNGRLVVLIGVAVVHAAEFVILRFSGDVTHCPPS